MGTLYVTFLHPSGIGEENVALKECFTDGRAIAYHQELEYFQSMLELFADMCLGRNYICKASIKDWFPIPSLFNNM